MVKTDHIRSIFVKNLKAYLGIPLVRSNQTAQMPDMPYGKCTITTLATANNGTYGEYEDNIARKPVKQIWSIIFEAETYEEAVNFASKARAWADYAGTTILNDNGVIVESVGVIGDRSNLLTVEYQYSYGFDITFWAYDEVEIPDVGEIETVDLGNGAIDVPPTEQELNERLEKRLDGEVV